MGPEHLEDRCLLTTNSLSDAIPLGQLSTTPLIEQLPAVSSLSAQKNVVINPASGNKSTSGGVEGAITKGILGIDPRAPLSAAPPAHGGANGRVSTADVPSITADVAATTTTLAARMGADDTFLYANFSEYWPDDPAVSGEDYYIQIDNEVMEVTAGTPYNAGPGSPAVLTVVRNISGFAAGPVAHENLAAITFVGFTYTGAPTLAAPLAGSGATASLQITNPPSNAVSGDMYMLLVDTENILVQFNAGNWYIIARGVSGGTSELAHNAEAPIDFGEGDQIPPPLLHTAIAASGGVGTTFYLRGPLPVTGGWTYLVQIGSEKMLIATTPNLPGYQWKIVARGVDGTEAQKHANHAAGSEILFFGPSQTTSPTLEIVSDVDQAEPDVPFETVVEAINPTNGEIDTAYDGPVSLDVVSSTLPVILGGQVAGYFDKGMKVFKNTLNTANDTVTIGQVAPGLAPAAPGAFRVLTRNAITLTWTGLAASPLWDSAQNNNNVTNWTDGTKPYLPVAGGAYDLIFLAGEPQTTSTDDIAVTAGYIRSEGSYTFNGIAPLTLSGQVVIIAGTGPTTFNVPIILSAGTTTVLSVGQGSNLLFAGAVSGSGGIQKNGAGVWTLIHANNTYSGPTTLVAGEVGLENANQLGAGTLTVNPLNSAVLIDPLAPAAVSLGNPVVLQGTLDVLSGQKVTFTKSVAIQSNNSQINVAGGGEVSILGAVSRSTLTIGTYGAKSQQPGIVALAGTLTSTVDVRGELDLGTAFSSNSSGTINLQGGALFSVTANGFSCPINVESGSQISIDLSDSLGTGPLTFGDAAENSSYSLEAENGDVTLRNPLILNGGTLTVGGFILFRGRTSLRSPASAIYVSPKSGLDLQGGVTGTAHLGNVLAELNPGGVLGIGGALNFATVIVPAKNNFVALPGFAVGDVGLVETAKEVVLYPVKK